MDITLKYGKQEINLFLNDKNVINVLTLSSTIKKIDNFINELRNSLENPIGTLSLKELVRKNNPKKVVVILEDITRTNPEYPQMLSTLISELADAGVNNPTFVIAYGTHRKNTQQETDKLYRLDSKYKIIHHNCDDKTNLVSVGKLSTGTDLIINKTVAESDFIIATGNLEPHSFAGYSGGRKCILPGVSSRETITHNHAKVVKDNVAMGEIDANPIHLEMMEVLKKVKIGFMINVIRNHKREIIKIVSGDAEKAYFTGINFAKEFYTVYVKEQADVVIVSCSGYPRDVNLYQAQKCITAVVPITKSGGTIILLAECVDGIGQDIFDEWMSKYSIKETLAKKETDIVVEGHRAYLTKKIMSYCDVVLISSLDKKKVEQMNYIYMENMESAVKYVRDKYGETFKSYIIPNGSAIIPLLKN